MGELGLLLFVPALAAYTEATVAYIGDTFRPGRLVRHAMWGVRLGWLAQTGLLVAQAASADGFPWASWGGSLNLLVWLTVGGYLIWGCRAPYRLLGLAVMPVAVALFTLAWAAGGAGEVDESDLGAVFLAFHVGLVVAAFAGFTLAAALAGLYLSQERRLKRRQPRVLRLVAPSLENLDALAGKTIAVALPALVVGAAVGLARAEQLDAVMAVTLVAAVVYGAYVLLRYEAGWRGRRAAYLALAGFILVLAALLPVSHF
jgi:ABC-type transport system involved in cytochrome c biogenesis permease subunit